MARRHNKYAQILGTAENNPMPLTRLSRQQRIHEQMSGYTDMTQGPIPNPDHLGMTGVPDLHDVAESCAQMSQTLDRHATHLRALADIQPNFADQFSEGVREDIGLPSVGY